MLKRCLHSDLIKKIFQLKTKANGETMFDNFNDFALNSELKAFKIVAKIL